MKIKALLLGLSLITIPSFTFSAVALPSVKISLENIENKSIIDLIYLSKLESSKSEIRRLLKGNAIKINDNTVSEEKFVISRDLFKENYLKLSIGKKRHIKIKIN